MFSVANPAQTQAVFPTVLNWWNAGSPFYVLGGWNFVFAMPNGSKTTSYQLSDDLVKTRGKHTFAFGVSFLRTYMTGFGCTIVDLNGSGFLISWRKSPLFTSATLQERLAELASHNCRRSL